MQQLKPIIVIPARLASSRLPNKVFADIGGYPMLWHVYQRCLQATNEVHVVTDAEIVVEMVQSWGGKAWLTDTNCASGTERIVAILAKLEADIIVNVQGDQPLISPFLIKQLIEVFTQITPLPDIVTPICHIKDKQIFDPNLVKAICRHDGYALYFSRHPIPFVRDVTTDNWQKSTTFFGHVGIYGYCRQVLEEYHLLPTSPLEEAEKLEQLRFLQAGKSIFTFVVDHYPISVDTPADLERVRLLMKS